MLADRHFTITPQPTVWFGVGQSERIGEAVRSTGQHRALLVTDATLRRTGIVDSLRAVLERDDVDVAVFDDVVPNPSTHTLDAGADALRRFGDAAVVAIGGGSSLDVAKGIAVAGVNEGSGRDFDYRNEQPVTARPVIAVPTTAGTGSETNAFGVIDDPLTGEKFYVGHSSTLPRVAILDPRLHVGLPARATAATGIDALAHAIECMSSANHNPYADSLAFQASEMIATWLPAAVENGNDLEARAQMALASHLAGAAFAAGTGLGLGHGIAHAVSARCGAIHGDVLGVVLPAIMRYNLDVCEPAYARLAAALGFTEVHRSSRMAAQAAIDAVSTLSQRVGVTGHLSQFGCTLELLDGIALAAQRDEVTLNAPRTPTLSDIHTILEEVL